MLQHMQAGYLSRTLSNQTNDLLIWSSATVTMISSTIQPAVLMSHPTGNQNVRNALRSLVEHDMLSEFWTTIAWNPKSVLNRLLPATLQTQMMRRTFLDAPRTHIRTVPWREVVRLASRSLPLGNAITFGERTYSFNGVCQHFDRTVANHIGKKHADIVYAYEDSARNTFHKAKQEGITTVYELPSSHWGWKAQMLSEERELNPDFAGLLPDHEDSASKLASKDEELSLSDYVFVPSQHVRNTLDGFVAQEKIRVINYGAPPIQNLKVLSAQKSKALKVIFVGSLTQRKGISYLLDAVDQLKSDVELTLIGMRYRANSIVDAACSRGRWFETLPHSEVIKVMREADVLVLPSLAEGCALVVLEALACGLPVIITPNTGSLEFVRDGREGYVVPIRNADAIADRLSALNQDRELLVNMSRNAQIMAESKSWKNYRATWAVTVKALSWR